MYIDTQALLSFTSFKAAWNYPEAQLTGMFYANNITVITTSERPFNEDPSILFYYGPANMTALNINLSGQYTNAPHTEWSLWYNSNVLWVPNDSIPHIFQHQNLTLKISNNTAGTKYITIATFQTYNIYRPVQVYFDSVYSPGMDKPYNPVFVLFGSTNAKLYLSNVLFENSVTVERIFVLVLFQQSILNNIAINNSSQIGYPVIFTQYLIAFVVSNITFSNIVVPKSAATQLFLLGNFDFTYTVISFISMKNWSISNSQILYNVNPLNQMIIANGSYEGLSLSDSSTLYSSGTVQSMVFTNHTFSTVSDDTYVSASVILKLDLIDLNSTQDSIISDVSITNSEVSIIKFGSTVNKPPASKNIIIQNINYLNSNIQASRSLIDTSNIKSNESVSFAFINIIFSNVSFVTIGNLFLLKHHIPVSISIINSSFTNLTSSVITVDSLGSENISLNTKISFDNWTFSNINTKFGSMINTENNAVVTIKNSKFTNIFTYEEAAILYAGFQKTSVSFTNCIFQNNSAVQGTLFVIQSESVVVCTNWTIINNFGVTNAIVETSTNGYFMFYNSVFSENYAINYPFGELLDGANLWIISNSSILNNEALSVDSVKYELTTRWYKLCFVSGLFSQYILTNNILVSSNYRLALIQLILSSLSIQDGSTISNQNILFNILMSSLIFSDSKISNVSNSIQLSSSNMTVINTNFIQILNDDSTDFIFMNLDSSLTINSSLFVNSSTSIINSRNSMIQANDITFYGISSPSSLWRIANSNKVLISKVKIEYCTSVYALFVIDQSVNVALSSLSGMIMNETLVQITNSNLTLLDSINVYQFYQVLVIKNSKINMVSNWNFTENGQKLLKFGGAVFISDSMLNISNSIFKNNTAINGGAISFEWRSLEMWNLTITNSIFESNTGVTQGGGIYYNYNRPILQNIIFKNNSAEYGLDIASYPVKIIMSNSSTSQMIINDMASGIVYNKIINLAIMDYDEQIMILNNINQVQISPVNRSIVTMKGVSTALLKRGISTFSNIIADTKPGSANILFQASSKAIDLSKIKDVYFEVNNNIITTNFRFCKPGEIQQSDNTCALWSPGTYSFYWNSTQCLLCPQNAAWLGGTQIYVDSGFWRKSSNTSTIVPWINAKACKGGYIDQIDAPVECEIGYTGILCSDWGIINGTKYEKVSDTTCQKCPNPALNAIRVVGMIILIFLFITWIIIVNIRKTKESQMSILLRILTNYLQLISWTMSFNIKYPSSLIQLLSPFKDIGSSSEVFLSFDWFVTDFELKGPFGSNRMFKIFLTAFLPLILLIIFAVIWMILKLIRKTIVPNLQRNIIISFISIVFLLHPRLVQNSFTVFECVKIDSDDNRTIVNIEIIWFSSSHIKWMIAIALPILIVWVISMPLIALILLFKNYKKDSDNKVKQYFLILYQGLKEEWFYWEFVNTLRKALILIAISILSTVSIVYKIVISSIVLIISMRVQQRLRPYKDEANNEIELRAIIASFITVITGIIYVQDNQIELFNTAMFIIIVIINSWFLLEWMYLFSLWMQHKYRIFKIVSL